MGYGQCLVFSMGSLRTVWILLRMKSIGFRLRRELIFMMRFCSLWREGERYTLMRLGGLIIRGAVEECQAVSGI